MVTALHFDDLRLHLINDDNLASVYALFQGYPDSPAMLEELLRNYLPKFDHGMRTNYGFYTLQHNELAGMHLLSIDDWDQRTGSLGADVFCHMRGRGITPRTKPPLFYLAFEVLGLNRVATGCRVSNLASKRSLEKTVGLQLEGIMRESGRNEQGAFEDEYLYAILRRDWLRLYDKAQVTAVQ